MSGGNSVDHLQHYIYMNNAATSYPKPDCVKAAVSAAIENLPGAANRGGLTDFNVFDEVRKKLAALMNIDVPDQIALGANATWALNLAIFGLPFAKGDTVVTTKIEHNSVLRPLYKLEQSGLIKVVYVDCDSYGRIDTRAFAAAVRQYQPRLTVFSHASNVTGAVNNAKELCQLAQGQGSKVLIDCSQSLGWLKVDVKDIGAEMIAFTGHKYLLGPQGTGGLYVSPALRLTPHLVGGTGIHSDLAAMPEEMPIHLEAGTGNEPSFAGLLAALDWACDHPTDRAAQGRKLESVKTTLRQLGVRMIDPPGPCTPVVSFNIDGMTPEAVADLMLGSYDIICRHGLHCAPKIFDCLNEPLGTVRISLSRFTTEDEIAELLQAVADIKEAGRGV